MKPQLAAVLVFASLTGSVLQAQPDPQPKDGIVRIEMPLKPTAAPKPLSNYYLTISYADRQPGEQLGGFLKCFMEQSVFFNAENSKKREDFLALPLDQLPKDVREQCGIHGGLAYSPKYATFMVFMDQAARYTRVEWNEYFNLRADGIYTLLPEIQKLRELARVLHLRLRGEVKNGEFERAVVTIRTMVGLGQMLDTHPTMIGGLVGIAITQTALHGLEEMIRQPGCPNLYWSLSDLPTPLFKLRNGLDGERMFLLSHLQPILDVGRPIPEERLIDILRRLDPNSEFPSAKNSKVSSAVRLDTPYNLIAIRAAHPDRLAEARKRLGEMGVTEAQLKKLSPLHIVTLDDYRQYEIIRDDYLKTFHWNSVEGKAEMDRVDQQTKKFKESGSNVLAPLMLPALSKIKSAQTRIDQRVALLRAIEAIRLHAFTEGKLPKQWADLKYAIGNDPLTGKPFTYELTGESAVLYGANPTPGFAGTNRRFAISIVK